MADTEQYYPTPPDLAQEMIRLIDNRILPNYANLLEPSAGEGYLAEAAKKGYIEEIEIGGKKHRYRHDFNCRISCIEKNKQRQATLRGKDYSVIWDDFLTFDPLMHYDVILMNPPFNNGARHLLKALEVCAAGGQIVCLLNAETLKNPYTNERKALAQKLEEQATFQIRYKTAAFANAERSTNVEIALVYIKKPAADNVCVTFDNFKRQIFAKRKEQSEQNTLVRHGEVDMLIDIYQAEAKAALALYQEMKNYQKISLMGASGGNSDEAVFMLKVNSIGGDDYTDETNIIRKINYKYWRALLYSKELSYLMTSDIQREYYRNLTEMAGFEFNERNILAMKEDLSRNLLTNIDTAVMKVWEEFTSRYSCEEYSKNIHYYNGWKTNKAFRCNKKIILPLRPFSYWDLKYNKQLSIRNEAQSTLNDIEKAMNYLDSGRTEHFDMTQALEAASNRGQTSNIDTKFFKVTCYKKGTIHLTFKDLELLKKFNIYCGKKKNWLPDDYGRKPYSHLSKEEIDIVESFEGVDSYMDTHLNKDFYLQSVSDLPLLDMRR